MQTIVSNLLFLNVLCAYMLVRVHGHSVHLEVPGQLWGWFSPSTFTKPSCHQASAVFALAEPACCACVLKGPFTSSKLPCFQFRCFVQQCCPGQCPRLAYHEPWSLGFGRVSEQSGAQNSGSPFGLLLSIAGSLAQPDRADKVHLQTWCLVAMDLSLLGRLWYCMGEVWVLHALCAASSTARYSMVRWKSVLTLSK